MELARRATRLHPHSYFRRKKQSLFVQHFSVSIHNDLHTHICTGPVPRDVKISVVLHEGPNPMGILRGGRLHPDRMYTYFGLVSGDLDPSKMSKTATQRCLCFTNGTKWQGVHCTQEKRRRNSDSDWLQAGIPPIRSGALISVTHSSAGEVVFSMDGKPLYWQQGYNRDLFLYASCHYPGECVIIARPMLLVSQHVYKVM